MSEDEQPSNEITSPIERFIKDFFGPGNIAWPGQDPDSSAGRKVRPYLDILWQEEATEVPVVLPCRRETGGDLTAYVIAHSPTQAVVVADLLTAFVGPTYSSFDGLPARLNPTDPIDQAVLKFVGDGLAFKVTSPTKRSQSEAWKALDLLLETLRLRPERTWNVGKPVGRLLGEFEAALAAGDNFVSANLLDQIAATGRLSPANLANLKIKRLARLGRDAELLRLPGLADVVISRPPTPTRDAILAAIFRTVLAVPLEQENLPLARQDLVSAGTIVLPLLDAGLAGLGGEALVVAVLTADVHDDERLRADVLLDPHRRELVTRVTPFLANVLAPDATADVSGVSAETHARITQDPEWTSPKSWLELVAALSAKGADTISVLASQDWQQWDPPTAEDQAIADILAALGNEAADRAWLLAGPIVDAVGYDHPAARTARQLIEIALLNDRFSPGDLSGIVALTDIFLRSSPDATAYVNLLDDLEGESSRWAGPDRASVVLDLVDLLVLAACPDEDARLRLALALLRPLRDQDGRLESEQAQFARQLSGELRVGLEWPGRDETSQDNSLPDIPATQVLLYSLDERVLERTKTLLEEIAPNAKVRLSHEKVGSQSLKQQARAAEVIVMATRCAKHAATGFIRQHASGTSVVREADGSGSASLLRAAVAALRTRIDQ